MQIYVDFKVVDCIVSNLWTVQIQPIYDRIVFGIIGDWKI